MRAHSLITCILLILCANPARAQDGVQCTSRALVARYDILGSTITPADLNADNAFNFYDISTFVESYLTGCR